MVNVIWFISFLFLNFYILVLKGSVHFMFLGFQKCIRINIKQHICPRMTKMMQYYNLCKYQREHLLCVLVLRFYIYICFFNFSHISVEGVNGT